MPRWVISIFSRKTFRAAFDFAADLPFDGVAVTVATTSAEMPARSHQSD